ncbi:hypothetical protein CPLU01_11482 [Colletotrichum plurivorum]|uniref:Uncharacterized protein n=1 Tax=Colletotrichum plurivorum TaxID=2175906 RepID=A0A8H6K241_9PEZI|nr:hypothetical protein CPLU01_11482 [Colletotrichum plurivorum]
MKYFNAIVLGLASILASAPVVNAAECTKFDDLFGNKVVGNCCWGGTDNFEACARQNGNSACAFDKGNFCGANGVTPQQCVSADLWVLHKILN